MSISKYIESELPLISCICITSNRIVLLKKAINSFQNQDYPNKELVISYPVKDRLTSYIVRNIVKEDSRIRAIERLGTDSLGDARNKAVIVANGEYICIWDDDDWYHPNRLSYQFYCIKDSNRHLQASILNRLIFFDYNTHRAYLSFQYDWEGTLLCRKEALLNNKYNNKDKGEDSSVIDFLNKNKLIYHISKAPYLYVYVYHRGNTWSYHHFKAFFKRSELLSTELSYYFYQLINNQI